MRTYLNLTKKNLFLGAGSGGCPGVSEFYYGSIWKIASFLLHNCLCPNWYEAPLVTRLKAPTTKVNLLLKGSCQWMFCNWMVLQQRRVWGRDSNDRRQEQYLSQLRLISTNWQVSYTQSQIATKVQNNWSLNTYHKIHNVIGHMTTSAINMVKYILGHPTSTVKIHLWSLLCLHTHNALKYWLSDFISLLKFSQYIQSLVWRPNIK